MNKSIYGLTLVIVGIMYYTDPFEFFLENSNHAYLVETKDEQSRNNVIVVKQFLEYVLNQGHVALIDKLFSEHYVGHFGQRADDDGHLSDRDYLKQAILQMHRRFPEYHVHFYDLHVHNSIVTIYWMNGCIKNNLPFEEIDPDDEYENREGVIIFRLENNQIVESKYGSNRWYGNLRNLEQ